MKKKMSAIVFAFLVLLSMTACGSDTDTVQMPEGSERVSAQSDEKEQDPEAQTEDGTDTQDQETLSEAEQEETEMILNIQAGEHLLTATLAQNSSVDALVSMLSEGPVTIRMSDYANMEKVGTLPESLPRNDEQISTDAGDLILYQGNSFVIYYDTNSWNFTRLGKVNDVTQQELKEILGDGDVTVELSLSTIPRLKAP